MEYIICFFVCWIASSIIISIFEREARMDIVIIGCALGMLWPASMLMGIVFLICKFVLFLLKWINGRIVKMQLREYKSSNTLIVWDK